jgi:hypothetical protein
VELKISTVECSKIKLAFRQLEIPFALTGLGAISCRGALLSTFYSIRFYTIC